MLVEQKCKQTDIDDRPKPLITQFTLVSRIVLLQSQINQNFGFSMLEAVFSESVKNQKLKIQLLTTTTSKGLTENGYCFFVSTILFRVSLTLAECLDFDTGAS
jgi:hypothetical protein